MLQLLNECASEWLVCRCELEEDIDELDELDEMLEGELAIELALLLLLLLFTLELMAAAHQAAAIGF